MWTMDGKSKMAALVMLVAAVACILFCTFVALCPMGSLCESKNFPPKKQEISKVGNWLL